MVRFRRSSRLRRLYPCCEEAVTKGTFLFSFDCVLSTVPWFDVVVPLLAPATLGFAPGSTVCASEIAPSSLAFAHASAVFAAGSANTPSVGSLSLTISVPVSTLFVTTFSSDEAIVLCSVISRVSPPTGVTISLVV